MITETIRRQIGQMMMAGFPSKQVDDQARRLMEDYYVGNFVLFARNIGTVEETCRLCESLSRMAWERNGVGPLIAADQEGGVVCRISTGTALIPGPMAIAAAKADAAAVGRDCARALLSVGINTNLAPVLDVNRDPMNPIIGARAFSDNPKTVEQYGLSMLAGLQEGGVLAAVKHFPGHGNVKVDSHISIPSNNAPEEELQLQDLTPFRAAFEQGADALMTGHIRVAQYDSELPATLSSRIMTNVLRKEMGFSGIAMTDCMEMGAVRNTYGGGEGAVLAVEAGCDILCFSHTYEAVAEAVRALYAAVENGRISPGRIQRSYDRILRIKKKYHCLEPAVPTVEKAREVLYDSEVLGRHQAINRRSITCLRDSGGIEALLAAKRPKFFAPASLALTGNEDQEKQPTYFSHRAVESFGGCECLLPLNECGENIQREICARDYDVAVLGLYNARFREGQQEVLRMLEEDRRPLVVVLLGAPYDAAWVQQADAVIAAYEYTPMSVDAVLEAIRDRSFTGRLPIQKENLCRT